MNVPWAASHIVKSLKHRIFGLLFLTLNIPFTSLPCPLCFLNRNYSAQEAAGARRSCHTAIYMHVHTCLCTRVITDSGNRTVILQVDTGMALAQKNNSSNPPFSLYILYLLSISAPAAILQRPDSRTNGCYDPLFQ